MKSVARWVAPLAAVIFAFTASRARDSRASVSVAVTFDGLVLASHAVVIATPVEEHAQMEDGKIFTYTRLHVDNAVAGDAATGSDVYVRAFGGVVDHVGMVSEGEPTFTVGTQQLLFLRHGASFAYNVTANAQGQFTVVADAGNAGTGARSTSFDGASTRFRRSRALGMVLQPKNAVEAVDKAGASTSQSVRVVASPALAADVLEARAATDVVRDVAAAFKRLHAR